MFKKGDKVKLVSVDYGVPTTEIGKYGIIAFIADDYDCEIEMCDSGLLWYIDTNMITRTLLPNQQLMFDFMDK